MIRYWKHIEKKPYHKPWLDSNVNYSSKELSSPDDSYVSISFRKKPHVQQSRRLMDKQMQKYFDKADEALLNKQMSDRWRSLKSTFDSYMNLTVNERRRTSIANMRGYQLDKNRKILYSFEDNCAYNIKITDLFKIRAFTFNLFNTHQSTQFRTFLLTKHLQVLSILLDKTYGKGNHDYFS